MAQHYAAIHHFSYKEQPTGQQMGFITNRFKLKPLPNNPYQQRVTLQRFDLKQILVACSNGQCIVPANYEVDNQYKMNFLSSSLIFIDVDDDYCITHPEKLVKQLQHCTGYFYTFSHGKKGNRYRLIFQFDKAIHNVEIYKIIVELLAAEVNNFISYPAGYFEPFIDASGKEVTRKPILDMNAKNPLTPIRTGILKPVLINENATINAEHYAELARAELNARAEANKKTYELEMKSPVTFEELKEMTERIGHIPSGSGQGQLWSRLVYGLKHYANSGAITQEQGEELFFILSGNEQGPNAWNDLKPSGAAAIGSLIREAKERGHKRKPHLFGLKKTVSLETAPIENVKVDKYISGDLAKEWLLRKQKLLVESPTGSGKSTALLNASIELSKNYSSNFFIFSAPTRPLAKQLAKKHNVMLVRGTMDNLAKKVFQAQREGIRVFVATYDMTNTLMEWLSKANEHATFSLIIDEYHKTVTDYSHSFRMNTLTELLKAMERSKSVIALSGTPEDILKTSFDAIIRVNNGKATSPCQDFAVYTYEKQKDAVPMLVKLIDSWTKKNRKMLIYLNNTEVISQIYDILRKRGIVTRTVSAAEKQNNTYKQMIENEMIDEEVQVILATSVIADGISLKNKFNWECLVVANHFSQLFNTSLLKQMSNRFRNHYARFSVFMQSPTAKETTPYYIDAAYTHYLAAANRFSKEINSEYSTSDFSLYRASILEKRYGLLEESNRIVVDTHYLRYAASQSKERYYKAYRNAFIKALENILHQKVSGILELETVLYEEEHREELEKIRLKLEQQKAISQLQRQEGLQQFSEIFTKDIYEAFVHERGQVITDTKDVMVAEQFNCIQQLHKYTSFEVCKKVAAQVTRKHETHKFVKRLGALTDTLYYKAIDRNTPTKRLVNELMQLQDFYTREELLEQYEKLAKKRRIKLADVQAVANNFFTFEQARESHTRYYKLKALTLNDVAAEFNLTTEEMVQSFKNYLHYQKPVVKVALSRYVQSLETAQLQLSFA